ncbi:E3 ubiquitin-protein ligase RNF169 isoform X2 [Conger conger]|uniref:E3 ubiquitin-protein ligase RNF169 isoform X2 n=1 Tax=Conger conger TaxID=82655 RepID=UPI002A5A1DF7|nr:E3 ubiquitin-protein ligase RNF169 isoform X2 [Conger conger]
MAAAGPAKSPSGLIGQREKQKSRNGSKDEQPEGKETTRLLTLDEARCPLCHEIFLEPVTMPCRHSVCLPCFKQAVQFTSLCCPLCRLRVSSWARRQSREKGLVNTELWDRVRQSYPEKCKQRMERQEGEEKIFCSPAHICKPGDIRQDYEQQKNKVVVKEEKRTQPQQKMEDCGIPKHFQNSIFGVLSDLENEEPAGRRSRHASAFVRKTRSSPASSRILQNRVVQRSRSCTEGEEGRGKDGCPSRLSAMAEASVAYSYNAGILLSTENSRSLSAPALASERRHPWRGVAIATASKPERSISPESNDSISEELNHFKPIVCSPCTPPKRLPDGRFLEPTVVKSTPRNLSRSLQRPTSYEASPTILHKWRQIETDRQLSKVSSRGTATSPALDQSPAGDRRGRLGQDALGQSRAGGRKGRLGQDTLGQSPAGGRKEKLGQDSQTESEREGKLCNKRRLIFEQPGADHSLPAKRLAKAQTPPALGSCEESEDVADSSRRPILLLYSPRGDALQCPQKPLEAPEQRLNPGSRTSRRSHGRKRNQKTKHLEAAGGRARSRGEVDVGRLYERCLQQERQDRQLALRLQRQFNMEREREERRASPDRYLLRSWAFPDRHAEYSPRRSVRISKKS